MTKRTSERSDHRLLYSCSKCGLARLPSHCGCGGVVVLRCTRCGRALDDCALANDARQAALQLAVHATAHDVVATIDARQLATLALLAMKVDGPPEAVPGDDCIQTDKERAMKMWSRVLTDEPDVAKRVIRALAGSGDTEASVVVAWCVAAHHGTHEAIALTEELWNCHVAGDEAPRQRTVAHRVMHLAAQLRPHARALLAPWELALMCDSLTLDEQGSDER